MSGKQVYDLNYKKVPKQARAKATVNAIIQASAQILVEEGYAGLTTNRVAERAGVSIGSVYEYFPGKEAMVAAVATQLVEVMLAEMQSALLRAERLAFEPAMRHWIESLYKISCAQHQLLKVLLFQVPFVHQVPAVAGMRARLRGDSPTAQDRAGKGCARGGVSPSLSAFQRTFCVAQASRY